MRYANGFRLEASTKRSVGGNLIRIGVQNLLPFALQLPIVEMKLECPYFVLDEKLIATVCEMKHLRKLKLVFRNDPECLAAWREEVTFLQRLLLATNSLPSKFTIHISTGEEFYTCPFHLCLSKLPSGTNLNRVVKWKHLGPFWYVIYLDLLVEKCPQLRAVRLPKSSSPWVSPTFTQLTSLRIHCDLNPDDDDDDEESDEDDAVNSRISGAILKTGMPQLSELLELQLFFEASDDHNNNNIVTTITTQLRMFKDFAAKLPRLERLVIHGCPAAAVTRRREYAQYVLQCASLKHLVIATTHKQFAWGPHSLFSRAILDAFLAANEPPRLLQSLTLESVAVSSQEETAELLDQVVICCGTFSLPLERIIISFSFTFLFDSQVWRDDIEEICEEDQKYQEQQQQQQQWPLRIWKPEFTPLCSQQRWPLLRTYQHFLDGFIHSCAMLLALRQESDLVARLPMDVVRHILPYLAFGYGVHMFKTNEEILHAFKTLAKKWKQINPRRGFILHQVGRHSKKYGGIFIPAVPYKFHCDMNPPRRTIQWRESAVY